MYMHASSRVSVRNNYNTSEVFIPIQVLMMRSKSGTRRNKKLPSFSSNRHIKIIDFSYYLLKRAKAWLPSFSCFSASTTQASHSSTQKVTQTLDSWSSCQRPVYAGYIELLAPWSTIETTWFSSVPNTNFHDETKRNPWRHLLYYLRRVPLRSSTTADLKKPMVIKMSS